MAWLDLDHELAELFSSLACERSLEDRQSMHVLRDQRRAVRLTPSQRSEAARKREAAKSPEKRAAAMRIARAAMTPAMCSERTRKANETRRRRAART